MSIYCNGFIEKATYVSAAAAFLLLFGFCFQAYASQPGMGTRVITIVLDPGHGGNIDFGAKGPYGKLEKEVTLKLAGMIASDIGTRFNIILTRTEDTELDLPERTAIANHFNADLFISIHAGGGFVHKTRGITICYYKNYYMDDATSPTVNEPKRKTLIPQPAAKAASEPKIDSVAYGRNHLGWTAADSGKNKRSVNNTDLPVLWKKIQQQHEEQSSIFASTIKKNLSGIITNGDIRISVANYSVLEGADMPAILIEAGCLTNPSDEEALSGKEYPSALVKGIGIAIDEYFQNIGLQEKIKRGKPSEQNISGRGAAW